MDWALGASLSHFSLNTTLIFAQQEIPGLTDGSVPRRLGPKRASKVRKLFNLSKQDDVRQYVIKRPLAGKEGKRPKTKTPKIQRLITPVVLQVGGVAGTLFASVSASPSSSSSPFSFIVSYFCLLFLHFLLSPLSLASLPFFHFPLLYSSHIFSSFFTFLHLFAKDCLHPTAQET